MIRLFAAALLISTAIVSPAIAQDTAGAKAPEQTAESYAAQGRAQLEARLAMPVNEGKAKNLIIFIGDGMGVSTLTAARIWQGQKAGKDGESTETAMDSLPYSAIVKTYSHDFQVSDSAATATALVTGTKTRSGMLGLTPAALRGKCDTAAGQEVSTLFEQAETAGKALGVISTARITHATGASAYAHSVDRNWESNADLPAGAACKDIARQLVEWPHAKGLKVVLSGGRAAFMPNTQADPEYTDKMGSRSDGRDLIAEWQQRNPQGEYVWNAAQFNLLDGAKDTPVFGLFEPSHMQFEADREKDKAGEPSLSQMTALAITRLQRADKGYVLMIEGGRIDHAHHGGNAQRALEDTVAFDEAVARALEMVDLDETLVLVTADHSHVFTIAGYPPRGTSIFGLASVTEDGEPLNAKDGKPYTTLGYANGPGAKVDGPRNDPAQEDTEALNYQQQATVPTSGETHAGEDVVLKAAGPSAHLFGGTLEQHSIYHIAKHILGM
ncbi:alkaline phosphatase [Blastomonas aquatica]|uniref:Alkaline phosphatase n=1 Tax=Blastomonas aquatica TaxID=1510276 RepID=A0ABQ1J162_9SPHN|nr:alkaline phosphatase [Blastomonas aquatica]GGB56238.1 alkaline phosphatase [Blastomonas aquatica]